MLHHLGGNEVVRLWEVEDAEPAGNERGGAGGDDGPWNWFWEGGVGEGGAEGASARDFFGVGAEEGWHEAFHVADVCERVRVVTGMLDWLLEPRKRKTRSEKDLGS